jgi:hypothetical protein
MLEGEAIAQLITPTLGELGWDVDDRRQIQRPFKVGMGLVDFCLNPEGDLPVLLEAKRPSENLSNHERQVALYGFEAGTPIAVLTSGVCWRFYLPMEPVPWKERRFASVDVVRDELQEFLERDRYLKGTMLEDAKRALAEEKKRRGQRRESVRQPRQRPSARPSQATSRSRSHVHRADGGKTKTEMVYEALCSGWITGPELTELTGQVGGWPKWVQKLYVDSNRYGELVLLWKRGVRPSPLRLATVKEGEKFLRESGVSIYPD